jgi:hypothetical protein
MKTLSTVDLAHVTGGTSSNSDQVLSSLQGIQSSLSDLGKNQNQGVLSGQNGLMFMTMATLAMSQRQSNVVVVDRGRGGYWHHRRHDW